MSFTSAHVLAKPVLPDRDCEILEIRVRGTVQGVGFRPTVWRLAKESGLTGQVCNDAEGVLITVSGNDAALSLFLQRLQQEAPPLARIEAVEVRSVESGPAFRDFCIVPSIAGENHTQVAPDAAMCTACREEISTPGEHRHRYPFTNCTHCGPRLSIVNSAPYDRANTTMSAFPMCEHCAAEYGEPANRRFHAQPIACPTCGPRVWLEYGDALEASTVTDIGGDGLESAVLLLKQGRIVAMRGLGGFHLVCDATNAQAVGRLRDRKQRYGKPFALMAHDTGIIRRYCRVSDAELRELSSPEAPIVLLSAEGDERLPDNIAPGLNVLGFMLPYTPLHWLITQKMQRPLVMTSGNLSEEPQIIDNDEAREKLKTVADVLLLHDREIANRIDDSVVRCMAGNPRLLRRARGHAPRAIPLPEGFQRAPDLLAYGGELKSTFCLLKDGAAIVSQHQGDLENVATIDDFQKNLRLYRQLYDHKPQLIAADRHPDYISTRLAHEAALADSVPLLDVQHHHAHIASCLAENGVPLDAPKVLGVALDGLGFGEEGAIWGGEFMLADYRSYRRLGTFKPVPMIGGAQAIREPWRSTYAHLVAAFGWRTFKERFGQLTLCKYLEAKPLSVIDQMLVKGVNVPSASSCGRLFDAVAAAVGLCRERALFEGQGAMELEALVDDVSMRSIEGYPFTIADVAGTDLMYIEPAPMWRVLLEDLAAGIPASTIATRFHRGLALAVADMVDRIRYRQGAGGPFDTVALSGGCFQNRVLLEAVIAQMEHKGLKCLTQSTVPSNDGGLSLGQAVIAAARQLDQG